MIELILKWGLLGIFALFLIVGFLIGIIRGVKRSGLHIVFVVVSVVLALMLTKTITKMILGITIPIGGHNTTISQYIFDMINERFDISQFNSVADLVEVLPIAAASPFVFIILEMALQGLMGIVYLIVARVSFGKKKEDFKDHKPHRLLGGLVGLVEGFALMFVLFSPLTSLARTANDVLYSESTTTSESVSAYASSSGLPELKPVSEMAESYLPGFVKEYLGLFNNSVLAKACSVGNIDHGIFDFLSTTKVGGEKVVLRKEMAELVETYDNFTVVYNALTAQDLSVSGAKLERSATKVVDGGLFKAVVAEAIRDFVVKYDEIKADLHLSLPTIAEEVIANLQPIFGESTFNPYEYLRHDFNLIVRTARSVLDDDIAEGFLDIENKNIENIMKFINSKEVALKADLKNLLNINMLDANFDLAIEKLTNLVREKMGDDTIELNSNIADKGAMVDQLFVASKKTESVSDAIGGIQNFIDGSGDVIKRLAGINNIGQVLLDIGEAVDNVRGLEIIVITDEVTHEKTYMFDKVLDHYGVDVLGDAVHGYPGTTAEQTTTLDTYTKLATYLRTPAQLAQNLGFLDLIAETEGVTFDDILDNLFDELNEDTQNSLLSRMLLPFHEITKQEVNTKVFDKAIDLVSDNLGTDFIDFTAPKTTNEYAVWNTELTYINQALRALSSGEIEDEGETLNYFRYMTKSGADIEKLMKEMINDNKIEEVLDPVFSADVFGPLTTKLFDTIDDTIKGVTDKDPNTNLTNLKTSKTESIAIIKNMLNIMLNSTDVGLQEVGKVLDILKTNAAGHGVFENIFNDIVWFATGDTMGSFSGTPGNDYYKDVKAYINPGTPADTSKYYTINYEEKFAELDAAIALADAMSTKIGTADFESDPEGVVAAIREAFDESGKDYDEIVDLLTDIKNIIDGNEDRGPVIDTSGLDETKKEAARQAIDEEFADEVEVATALKQLLGL